MSSTPKPSKESESDGSNRTELPYKGSFRKYKILWEGSFTVTMTYNGRLRKLDFMTPECNSFLPDSHARLLCLQLSLPCAKSLRERILKKCETFGYNKNNSRTPGEDNLSKSHPNPQLSSFLPEGEVLRGKRTPSLMAVIQWERLQRC